jgi:hypothetical protein
MRIALEDCDLSILEKRPLQLKGFYGTAIMDITVEDSSVCVLWRCTGLFTNYSTSDIPRMKKEMRAFLSSASEAGPPIYHSTFDNLSSYQDSDPLQDRKVGSLFLFQIPISIVLTSRFVTEPTFLLFCSYRASLPLA